jgi:hypothetical protein
VRHASQVRAPAGHRPKLNIAIVTQLADYPFHDLVQQLVPVADIPGQRHGADAQPGRHGRHGRGADALLVHELQRGRHDPLK